MSSPQLSIGRHLKRTLDASCALVGILFASPFMALTALGLRISVGSPVLFKHQRPGLNAQPFVLYKFRTMTNAIDSTGKLLPDEQRLTRFGNLVRSLSLDELPQLWNVLRGDMSLVGPRPLLMQYLPRYNPRQARRHEVMPGITGWAQINGRNALSWDQKFELDVWYVEHWSLWLDIKIIFRTAAKVVLRRGISSSGHVTMPEFMGNSQSSS